MCNFPEKKIILHDYNILLEMWEKSETIDIGYYTWK